MAGLSHVGMRRYLSRKGCPTRACGAINEGRSHSSQTSLRRHARTPRARAGVSRQRGLATPAGRTHRARAARAAARRRPRPGEAGGRGAEAEGARGEGQPGFDSWRALTAIPSKIVVGVTNRPALLVSEAGLHALPRIEPRLLRLSARVAPSPMSSGRRFEVWVLRKRTFKPSGPAHHRNTVR